jgi:hypothetical protein
MQKSPSKPWTKFNPRRPFVRTIEAIATDAIRHYANRGPGPVHVFPVMKSETSAAARTRLILAAGLAGVPEYTGRAYAEARAAELGYNFVEVDINEYS